jgi:hypothetical protein
LAALIASRGVRSVAITELSFKRDSAVKPEEIWLVQFRLGDRGAIIVNVSQATGLASQPFYVHDRSVRTNAVDPPRR